MPKTSDDGVWSSNPCGNNWAKDDSKYGQRLMEKMGWSKGKGLGKNEDGNPDNVKVSAKKDVKGVGYKGYDDTWVEHQEEFDKVLGALNGNRKADNDIKQIKNFTQRSQNSKTRVHKYAKHVAGKDLSGKSEKDLKCIFGNLTDKNSNDDDSTRPNCGSMKDYFAKKMLEKSGKSKSQDEEEPLKLKKETDNVDESVSEDDKKKKKKKKRQQTVDVDEKDVKSEQDLPREKKIKCEETNRKKKKQKNIKIESVNEEEIDPPTPTKSNKKSKRKRKIEDEPTEDEVPNKKPKKSLPDTELTNSNSDDSKNKHVNETENHQTQQENDRTKHETPENNSENVHRPSAGFRGRGFGPVRGHLASYRARGTFGMANSTSFRGRGGFATAFRGRGAFGPSNTRGQGTVRYDPEFMSEQFESLQTFPKSFDEYLLFREFIQTRKQVEEKFSQVRTNLWRTNSLPLRGRGFAPTRQISNNFGSNIRNRVANFGMVARRDYVSRPTSRTHFVNRLARGFKPQTLEEKYGGGREYSEKELQILKDVVGSVEECVDMSKLTPQPAESQLITSDAPKKIKYLEKMVLSLQNIIPFQNCNFLSIDGYKR